MRLLTDIQAWAREVDWVASLGWVAGASTVIASVVDALATSVDLPAGATAVLVTVAGASAAIDRCAAWLSVELEVDHNEDGRPLKEDPKEQLQFVMSGLQRAIAEARKDRNLDGVVDADDFYLFFRDLIFGNPVTESESENSDPAAR